MPAAQPKTKVVPSSAVAGHPERPSSAASYNSWVRENVTDDTKIEDHERTSTPVQFLSPNAGSVVSLREAGDVKGDEPAEPPPSRRSRPATPILDRPVSPKPVRSASPSLSHRLKTNAVVPTDAELPVQEPKELKKPEPVEAWSDVSDGDSKNGDAKETRAKSAGRSKSNHPNDSPGEGAHTGSAANMHSVISVREAAQDQRLDGMSVSGRLTPTQVKQSSTSPGGSKRNEDSRSVVSRTSGQIAPPQPAKQQQAYIPYMCARDTISKVVEDMQTMKNNHVDIVQKIQDAYKKIENETQSQFNIFVLGLRTQYKEKVKTFRQVIVVHQQELDSLKNYWESTITSLSQKNKELMKEKRKLLLINKTDIEKLQTEKDNLMTELTSKLDEEGHSYSERIKQLQETEKSLEDEKKILEDKLASEKDTVKEREREIEQLRAQLNETGTPPIVMAPGTDSEVNRENNVLTHQAGPSALVVAGLSAAERDRIIAEKDQFQDKMIEAQKELVIMQTKYANLENQYRSVAAMAKNDEESITAQMDDVKNDVNILMEEKDNLTEEIKKWEEDYKERTGEEPTEEDRPESIKELYTQLDEVEIQKSKLDAQLTALSDLKEGNIPEPEEIVVPEPIIKTVEVTVADPSVLAELEVSQARNEQLEKEIQSLKDQMNEAQKSLKKVEKENKKLRSGTIEGAQSKDNANAVLVLQALIHQMNTSEGVNQQDKTELESQVQQAREEKQQVEAKQLELKEKLDLWAQQFEETNGRAPEKNDRDEEVEKLYQGLKEANEKTVSLEAQIMAHSMILTGEMPENFDKVSTSQVTAGGDGNSEELNELRERLQELEEEVEELTEKNNRLENTLEEMEEKKQSLEERIDELQSGVGVPVVEGTTPVGVSSASSIPSFDYYDEDDVEGLGAQINLLRQQQDDLEKQLEKEREAHEETKEELEELKQQLEQAKEDEASAARDSDGKAKASSAALLAEMALQTKSLEEAKQRIDELENEKLKDVPADSADEIRKLREKVKASEAEKDEAQKLHIQKTAEVDKLKVDMETTQKSLAKERETNRGHQETMKKKLAEKDKQAKEMVANAEQKFVAKEEEKNKQIKTLEKKLKEAKLSGTAVGAAAGAAKGGNKVDAKTEKKIAMMQEHINNLKKQVEQDKNTIKQLEKDVKEAKAGNSADKQAGKKTEKQLKDLEKKLENETKKFEREQKKANELETQLKAATKERDTNADEIKKLQTQIDSLGVAATEALELKEKVGAMTAELKELKTENKTLTENYNSERVLRKKYYNMVEDMKGKIRVYCRARPLSGSEKDRGNYEIVKAPDEYSINVESNRGNKEFQFDHIFMPDSSQEDVFEDTNNLIQSAVDGYNVCIFAYGQTGSGKTFTMIGDKGQNFPGIAPRAFKKIFEVIEENKSKFTFKVYTYMCELYNDKLIDLYSKDHKDDARLDIKKDKKGMVFIQGAVIQEATNSKELNGLFEQGSENRHVASTNMNSESSRSHLILAIIIESTNLSTGSVTKGKLSLVDLAGSERAAKTGATAAQLKEANSINKSLSALGDVIAALSSEQQFIPYRNNKLTMLMQDSLGGNAKTLMFVNISPADYNAEETIISLTYASRVKLITNDASKNADNKEIARLKSIIAKLKSGETVGDEEVDGTDD